MVTYRPGSESGIIGLRLVVTQPKHIVLHGVYSSYAEFFLHSLPKFATVVHATRKQQSCDVHVWLRCSVVMRRRPWPSREELNEYSFNSSTKT